MYMYMFECVCLSECIHVFMFLHERQEATKHTHTLTHIKY
jgi:hypothetical protein